MASNNVNGFVEVLYDVAAWIGTPKPQGGTLFAHLQAQGASGNIYETPNRLYVKRMEQCTRLVLVVAESKLSMVNKNLTEKIEDANLNAEHEPRLTNSRVDVLSYGQLFNMLKGWRDQNSWNGSAQAWCYRYTTFLMDVDPGFSAEFVLALNAATVFIKTYHEQRSATLVKLITMSSEEIHPIIGKLFNHFDSCQNFRLPELEDTYAPRHVFANNAKQTLLQLESWVHARGRHGKHTIITFYGEDIMPDEWRGDAFIGTFIPVQLIHPGFMEVIAANTKNQRILVSFPPDFQADSKFPATGTVHVVPSIRRRRTVWDSSIGHEIAKTIPLSMQERKAQMSASCWFEMDDESVYTYAPGNYLTSPEGDRVLSMKFACEQIEGFVAALADLENWPDETLWITRIASSPPYPFPDYSYIDDGIADVKKRLQIQGLLGHHNTLGEAIAPQDRLFHKINERLSYNGKVAYVMAVLSAPNFTLLKMHLSAALSVGLKRLVKINWEGCDAQDIQHIRSLAAWSRTRHIAPYGTLWTKLGLMEAIWTKHAAGLCRFISESGVVDGRVSALITPRSMWMACRQRISNLLSEEQVAVPNEMSFFNRAWEVKEGDYPPLCYDFLRAYSNQVAMVDKHENGLQFVDFTSWKPLNCTQDVMNLVDWDKILANESFPLIGFYTASIQPPDAQKAIISDWNWIPAGLWTTWGQIIRSNDYIGTEALKIEKSVVQEHIDEEDGDEGNAEQEDDEEEGADKE
ncbi:hypothetical protein FBEOM_5926 [Fusarium beomiforme]|uniref:Uncharacterized protein n=1 Tax=Fusarium beomiforme TaxID=44412 RepID=A0A9P5DZ84_9HYPO|nr:hypothetical protein FBEOM_5926 [Fusarium beomiforme]